MAVILTRADLRRVLGKAAGCLTPTEALVVCSIYLDAEPQRIVAEVLGCTKSNVCLIHRKALAKFRRALWPLRFDDLYPDTLSRRDDAVAMMVFSLDRKSKGAERILDGIPA